MKRNDASMIFKIYYLFFFYIVSGNFQASVEACGKYNVNNLTVSYCDNITLAELPPLDPKIIKLQFSIQDSNLLTIPRSSFDVYKTPLAELNLSFDNITHILPGAFSNLDNLNRLFLDNNELVIIPKDAFNKNLKELYLRSNRIRYIDPSALSPIEKLTHLDLSFNLITTLVGKSFQLPNLATLKLDSNTISSIAKDAFQGLHLLTFLSLSRNNIKEIDPGTLRDLRNQEYLNFHSNQIRDFVDGTFDNLTKLEVLDASNNKLKRTEVFRPLLNLEELKLSYNYITELKWHAFKLPKLRELDLNYNHISRIDVYAFSGLHSLTYLFLSHNSINELVPGVFKDLDDLLYLKLDFNEIEWVPKRVFKDLESIRDIKLSNNKLKTLENYYFESLSSLEDLAFDHNEIRSFDAENVFKNLSQLYGVKINHNPLDCDTFRNVKNVFSKEDVIMLDANSTTCQ